MLRATGATGSGSTHGRRGAVTAASAAVVCLGAALVACGGGGGGGGYVAVGPVGDSPGTSATAAGPTGSVTLVPLDGPDTGGGDTGAPGNVDSPASSSP